MPRIASIVAQITICPLVLAATILAQISGAQTGITYVPLGVPSNLYTPEIQLGSATQPAIVTVPPIEEATPASEPYVSNAPPASTALLATRHFDFITAPEDVTPGSMEDTSISLGDYARQLRAEKQKLPMPNAIANSPTNPPSNCPTISK